VLVAAFVGGLGGAVVVAAEAVLLIATVFAAVYHAITPRWWRTGWASPSAPLCSPLLSPSLR
jgi:hypothetical protein